MNHWNWLAWALPFAGTVALVASGRVPLFAAGAAGWAMAVAVAVIAAPLPFGAGPAAAASLRGAWVGSMIGAIIIGGLFFRLVVHGPPLPAESPGQMPPPANPVGNRRAIFLACFVLGPFNEIATGFGLGLLTAAGLLAGQRLRPAAAAALAINSQVFNPWGALATGSVVAAELSATEIRHLGAASAVLSLPVLLAWLAAYWAVLAREGLRGSARTHALEAAALLLMGLALIPANLAFGAEAGALLVVGAVVLASGAGRRAEAASAIPWRILLPYAGLIAGLAAARGLPWWQGLLQAVAIRPAPDWPAALPLLHPAAWLVAIALLAATLRGEGRRLPGAARQAVGQGWRAVAATIAFVAMAHILSACGIVQASAELANLAFGPFGLLLLTGIAGVFGVLTGSSNATNGLLIPPGVSLAAANGLPALWIAAILNTTCSMLTAMAPWRVALACAALPARPDERAVIRACLPLAASILALMMAATLAVIVGGWI